MSTGEWENALRLFRADQRGKRIDESTIDRRIGQLTRLSRELPRPWQTTREDVLCALDSLGVAASTRQTYRDALRAFYRWAAVSGRVVDDPTEEPSRRLVAAPISSEWDEALRAFRGALRAEGIADSTIKVRLAQLRRFGRDHAHMSPWAVTLDDLLEYFGAKRWSKETRRGHRSAIRSFYRWAKRTGRVKKSPAAKLPVVEAATPVPRPVAMSDYQIALVRADERETLALRMAMELGMRCGEVARSHSADLRGEHGRWTLLVHGKGDRKRSIPVHDDLARSMRTRRSGYLFPGQIDGHLSPHYLGKIINRILPPGVTMHMLRHRFATDAYAIHRDTFSVQRLLGHASPATTQRYVQIDDDSLRETVEAVRARQHATS